MEFAPGDLPSPDLAKMMEELRQTIWKDPALFVEALNQIGPQNPQLLFTLPGNPNLQEEAIELPEGLLLAEQEHGPVVLAVLRESTSDKAGLHPGDQLSLINETIPVPTLEDWRTQYPKAKAAAKLSSRAWTVQILRPGETKTQTLSFKPPTNLSGVMDLPVE
jgi:S1-C subfamily serine protease